MTSTLRNLLVSATLLLFVISMNAAPYLQILGPINATLGKNGTIFLGKVGPGESFYILASATTTNATGTVVNIGWDTLTAVNLPVGWSAQSPPLYGNPMKMKVNVAPNAQNGTYKLIVRAVNVGNYSKLGNLTFTAYVNVTTNVFNLVVQPTILNVGIGQPTNLNIAINNTGASDDPFVITATGLPAWNVSQTAIALHSTKNSFIYPVYENTPGVYTFNLSVAATTSPLVSKKYPITMNVKESLFNDYSAIGEGVVLSPAIYEPVYALMQFLNSVVKSFSG